MFLTDAELRELTGYVTAAGFARWLAARGWRFERNRAGKVIVSRAHAETMLAGGEPKAPDDLYPLNSPWLEEPWKAADLSPIAWLDQHFDKFRFTQEEVADRAWGPQCWGDSLEGQGFYFLLLNDRIVYVGISNNIPARIEQHKKSPKRFNAVAAFRAPQFVAQWMEAYYYEAWRPEYNDRPERLDDRLRHHLPS